MNHLLKVYLPLCAMLGIAIIRIPTAAALSMSGILSQPTVLGDFISNPYPTASLVKDGGTIYFIDETTKIPFANYKAFTGLGYSLRNVISGNLGGYDLSQTAIKTSNSAHPQGSWISNRSAIFFSSPDGLIAVPSVEVFLSNGGKWNLVVKANRYDLAVLKKNGALNVLTDNDSRAGGQSSLQFSHTITSSTPILPISVPGPTSTASSTIVISCSPQIILPTNVYASTTEIFSASSSDPHIPLSYTFNWGDGTPSNSVSINSLSHIYSTLGSYMLSVIVMDNQQNATTSTTTVNVVAVPNFSPSLPQITLPVSPVVGSDLTFTTSASDPQGLPLTYIFSWGDGSADTIAASTSATHNYTTSDTFVVKVTASNNQGLSASNSTYLYVPPKQ